MKLNREIKWGILGCGNIAHNFATALKTCENAKLEAIASKTKGKAQKFSKKFHIKTYFENYEDLINKTDVDVIYIATTNNYHYENALLCLNNGINVLCEKPFTLNTSQADKLIKTSIKKELFLMEAMWTRFFPCIRELRKILRNNIIGDIFHLKADFGINTKDHQIERLINPKLGGGALLDLGIYTLSFAKMIFNCTPLIIKGSALLGKTGVDEFSQYFFQYGNNQTALCASSFIFELPHYAFIYGDKGYIEIPDFFHPSEMTININKTQKKRIYMPYTSNGYNYEIIEVMDCLNNEKIESSIMPLSDTLEIMKIMDNLRAQWGLKYPGE